MQRGYRAFAHLCCCRRWCCLQGGSDGAKSRSRPLRSRGRKNSCFCLSLGRSTAPVAPSGHPLTLAAGLAAAKRAPHATAHPRWRHSPCCHPPLRCLLLNPVQSHHNHTRNRGAAPAHPPAARRAAPAAERRCHVTVSSPGRQEHAALLLAAWARPARCLLATMCP